ncbi:ATPase, V0 complex, subunit E [Prunus dulcis]|uniref:ATPase, V0 complex, subunit E n=1 Tax=Prunus dulcis TaxID=3755 RepID=A0A4Y1R907_PRUDU|nr:ATPase, V0 complex, subunit E [Prunus dulcis]
MYSSYPAMKPKYFQTNNGKGQSNAIPLILGPAALNSEPTYPEGLHDTATFSKYVEDQLEFELVDIQLDSDLSTDTVCGFSCLKRRVESNKSVMGFVVTTLIFAMVGVIASLMAPSYTGDHSSSVLLDDIDQFVCM